MNESSGNGWSKYENLVLSELKRANEQIGTLAWKMENMEKEIAVLKYKSGLWGATAGGMLVVIWALAKIFMG